MALSSLIFTLILAPPTKGLPSLSSLPLLFFTVKKLVCLSAIVINFPSNSTQINFGNFEIVDPAFGFEAIKSPCAKAELGAIANPKAKNETAALLVSKMDSGYVHQGGINRIYFPT